MYFEKERTDLMSKFNRLTWNSSMRKISEMTARVRKIQAIVSTLTYLRSKAPYLWGKEAIQERLVSDLANIFKTVRETSKFDLLPSDFPNVNEFTVHLKRSDFTQFPVSAEKELLALQRMLKEDLPNLAKMVVSLGINESEGDIEETVEKEKTD